MTAPLEQGQQDPKNAGLPPPGPARQAIIAWCRGRRFPAKRGEPVQPWKPA